MPRSIKLKNNVYIDSSGITHNRGLLKDILNYNNSKNTYFASIGLASFGVTTATSWQIGTYVAPEDGTYLIVGDAHPNHYGQSGRELRLNIAKNWSVFYNYQAVCNTYTWTLSMPFCTICKCKKNDEIEIYLTNSDNTKSWSRGG